jgi:hypothetical protein
MTYVLPALRRAVLVACLGLALTVAAACTADEPEPEPRPQVGRNTINAADLGEQLTLTARVVLRLDDRSFVVAASVTVWGDPAPVAGSASAV